MKKRILFLLILLIFTSTLSYADEDYIEPLTEKAIILEVGEILTSDQSSGFIQTQIVKLEITSGKYKGEIRDIENHLSDNMVYNIIVEEGDKVVVMIEEYGDDIDVFIADYSRTDYMLYLTIFFILLMLVIGKTKGLKAIISLSLTIGSIFYILLPQLLKGANPIPISIGIAIGVTVITIFLVSGINSKSAAAIIGTSIGVVIAGLISYYVGLKINLTGLSAEEATMLMYIPQEITFDFKNLLFSGIMHRGRFFLHKYF